MIAIMVTVVSESDFRDAWLRAAQWRGFPRDTIEADVNDWLEVMRMGAVMSMPDGMQVRLQSSELAS